MQDIIRERSWREFTSSLRTQLTPDSPLKRLFIEESWERSRLAGVKRREPILRRVEDFEFQATAANDQLLLSAAAEYLDGYSHAWRCRHVICLTNARGIILRSVGDASWRAAQGLMEGFDWSERQMGTNGAGTALETNQVVVLIGPEHYLEEFGNATCIGVPLHAPDGAIVGALDFSSAVENAEPNQVLKMVELGAAIEAKLRSF